MRPSPRRLLLLTGGCVVLGTGVALLLTADLGSDGFSTLVNGVSISSGTSFWFANVLVSLVFMEWRSALLVAVSIPVTVAFILGLSQLVGIDLQQVSIAALIIA